jgi:hypothetical protein
MKYTFDKTRPLSWSSKSSFDYNREEWFESYYLGKKKTSKEMDFGSYVDKKLQTDPTFLPFIPRYEHMQYPMNIMFGKIPLVGIPDGLNLTNSTVLADYKTGKKAWDKKRADETGQLSWYLLMLYVIKKIKPEDFKLYIHWLPTEEKGDFSIGFVEPIEKSYKVFETKRTMLDILNFGSEINKTYEEMRKYVESHP